MREGERREAKGEGNGSKVNVFFTKLTFSFIFISK